jgi:hypothetical protein
MSARIIRLTFALLAVWCAPTASAFAISPGVSAISYEDADGDRRIFAFARGDNGHLVVSYFDGATWQWFDHGVPAGATSINNIQALTYVDSGGIRRIYVFALSSSNHLVVRYWNGVQWQWANQGGPALKGDTLSVINYLDSTGNRRIYAFGINDDVTPSHLVTNYWNGFTWQWADNGSSPDGVTSAEAITYLDDNGVRRIDVFVRAYANTTFPLWVNSWTGSSWTWTNHGGSDIADISAVTYVDTSGHRRIYAFMSRQNQLWVRWWNGFAWAWTSLGEPAGQENRIFYDISAITYLDDASNRRLYAFTELGNQLFVKYWNGFTWNWASQGLPTFHTSVQTVTALTFLDNPRGVTQFTGTQKIYVFTVANPLGHLVINYWDGDSWQWIDNGTP